MAEIICPEDCTTTLPVVAFDDCNPEVNLSEITHIYLALSTAPPLTSAASAVEWADRLAESDVLPEGSTSTVDELIRPLVVIGDKPAPTETVRELSNGRRRVLNKAHVVNFTIDETNVTNHTFIRTLECGGKYRAWYKTAGGKLFGGNEGIIVEARINMILNRGVEEIETYAGTLEWKSKHTEDFVVSPI